MYAVLACSFDIIIVLFQITSLYDIYVCAMTTSALFVLTFLAIVGMATLFTALDGKHFKPNDNAVFGFTVSDCCAAYLMNIQLKTRLNYLLRHTLLQ